MIAEDIYASVRGQREWTRDRPKPEHLSHIGIAGVEIVDARRTHGFNYNTLIEAYIKDDLLKRLVPIDGLASVCSGEPAVLYRTREAEIAMTGEEIYRMCRNALTPEEFEAIVAQVGAIWELHDDFYDPDTGEALQPQVEVPGYAHLTEDFDEDEGADLRH